MADIITTVLSRIEDERRKSPHSLTPVIRKVSRFFYRDIKMKSKSEIIELCERLLASGGWEGRIIAFDWAFLLPCYDEKDFAFFEKWARAHVHDWGSCDDLCTHALGRFIFEYPVFIKDLFIWASDDDWPIRRAAPVSLIYGLRRGVHFDDALEMADRLLPDKHDLVRKGYGWMLKEMANRSRMRVYDYVMSRKTQMPRVALRYAIEKMPDDLRRQAMT